MYFPITFLKSSFENGLRRFASNQNFSKSIIAGLRGDHVTTIALPLNPDFRRFLNVSIPPIPPFIFWSKRTMLIKIFL
jgi:hypothetical protein